MNYVPCHPAIHKIFPAFHHIPRYPWVEAIEQFNLKRLKVAGSRQKRSVVPTKVFTE
jgi:hypothetical protein